jgi:large subunit ribosomal protein L18
MKKRKSVRQKLSLIRKKRTRAKIKGTVQRPRLSVFRSNKRIYAQLIDDQKGETLVAVGDASSNQSKMEKAREVGNKLAGLALKKGVKEVVFDRGSYRFHGRVKALAEGAREKGLKF